MTTPVTTFKEFEMGKIVTDHQADDCNESNLYSCVKRTSQSEKMCKKTQYYYELPERAQD